MATYNYFVTNNGNLSYQFSGISDINPTLTFQRGDTVVFNVIAEGHPFWIKTTTGTGTDNAYNDGVVNNGEDNGTITFVIPDDAPTALVYQCQNHTLMNGLINIQLAPTTTTTTTSTTTEEPVTTTTSTTTDAPTTTTQAPIVVTTTPTPDDGTGTTTTTQPPDYIEPIVTNLTNVAPDYTGGVLIVRSQANNSPWFGGTDSDINLSIIPFIGNFTMEPISNVESIDVVWNVKGSGNSITRNFTQFDRNFRTVALTIEGQYAFAPNKTYELKFVWKRSDGSSVTSDSVEFVVLDPSVTTTTTTTTTTDSPADIILDRTQLNECPCGIVTFPAGGTGGLKLIIKDDAEEYNANFIHTSEVKLENEQKFVTITDTIKDNITAKDLAVYIDVEGFSRLTVENVISITVKEYNTRKVIANVLYGTQNAKTKSRRSELIDKPSIRIVTSSDVNLYDNALIFEFESLCDYNNKPCCDSLPTSIRLFGDDAICLPLEEYFPPDEINPDITTPPPPDEFVFVQDLTSIIDPETNQVTLSAQVSTVNNNPVMYQFELISGSCITRLTLPEIAEPNEIVTFTDTENFGYNSYRLLLTRPNYHEDIEPASAYSNSRTVNNTTTQPPEPPDPEKNTIYTTSPPPPTPTLNLVSYDDSSNEWSLSWNLNGPQTDLEKIAIRYRTNDGVNWSNWNSFNYEQSDPEWSSLEDGNGYVPPIGTTFDCLMYEFRVRAYKNGNNFSESASQDYITATTPDAPQQFSASMSETVNTDLEVSWSAPASNGGCAALSYVVEYREFGIASWTVATPTPISSTSLTISNLNASSEYFARVKAVNVWGMESPYSANDPNALMMLSMEDVQLINGQTTKWHTPDSSSYGRIVECNVGYINNPMVPAEYMVDDSAIGDKAFYTKPTDPLITGSQIICPFTNGVYNPNVQFSNYFENTANNLHFDSQQYGNTPLVLNNETHSKYIIDWWMKIPSLTGQFGADIEIISFFNNNTPYSGSDYLDFDLDTQTTGSFALKCKWNINRVANSNSPYYLIGFNQPLQETMTSITDTNWHHYAWVVDGELNNTTDNKYVRFYVDGELVFNRAKEFRWYLWTDPVNDFKYSYLDALAVFDQFGIGDNYTGDPRSNGNTRVCCMKVDQFRLSQTANFNGNLVSDGSTGYQEYAVIDLPNLPLGSTGYRFRVDGYEDSSAGAFSNVLLYMNNPVDNKQYRTESPRSMQFDGVADWIDISHDDSLNLPVAEAGKVKAYTVDFWTYMFNGNIPTGDVFIKDDDNFQITLSGTTGTGFGFTVRAYGVDAIVTLPSIPSDRFAKNAWYHHAIKIGNIQTSTGGNNSFDVTYYLDGDIVNTSTTIQYPNTIAPQTNKMRIGSTYGGFATYEGYLSHIRITQGARYTVPFTRPASMGEYYQSQDPMWNDVVLLITNNEAYQNSNIITDDSKSQQTISNTGASNNVVVRNYEPPLTIPNNPDNVGFFATYVEAGNQIRIYSRNGYGINNSPPTYVTIQAIDSGDNILGMPSEPIKIVLDEDG